MNFSAFQVATVNWHVFVIIFFIWRGMKNIQRFPCWNIHFLQFGSRNAMKRATCVLEDWKLACGSFSSCTITVFASLLYVQVIKTPRDEHVLLSSENNNCCDRRSFTKSFFVFCLCGVLVYPSYDVLYDIYIYLLNILDLLKF